jgi:hypothetical protein
MRMGLAMQEGGRTRDAASVSITAPARQTHEHMFGMAPRSPPSHAGRGHPALTTAHPTEYAFLTGESAHSIPVLTPPMARATEQCLSCAGFRGHQLRVFFRNGGTAWPTHAGGSVGSSRLKRSDS